MSTAWAKHLGLTVKPAKYRNRKTTVPDRSGQTITFDSAKEARRWGELQLLQRAGEIRGLERQVAYPLIVSGRKVCTIVPDFRYLDGRGNTVIEDTKSPATRTNPTYRLKRKLFEALTGLTITEV